MQKSDSNSQVVSQSNAFVSKIDLVSTRVWKLEFPIKTMLIGEERFLDVICRFVHVAGNYSIILCCCNKVIFSGNNINMLPYYGIFVNVFINDL